MNLQVIKIKVLLWLKRIVLYGLYILLILTITSFLILQIPAVQTGLSNVFLSSFSEASGFNSSIERVEFYWFDRVIIKDLKIKDPENNTMIGVKRLMVNFRFSGIFQENEISLDAATIDSAQVNIKAIYESDSTRNLNINIFTSRINQMGKSPNGKGGSSVTIGEAILKNSLFTYHSDRDTLKDKFDPNHFTIGIAEAELERFLIHRDTIQFAVRSLEATEKELNFKIHELSTFFLISQHRMELSGLKLRAGDSFVSDTLVFSYEGQKNLSYFIDSVQIHASLTQTIIHPHDLALFAPLPTSMNKPIQLSGEFNGALSNFRFDQFNIVIGDSKLQGSLDIDGLPDINESFIVFSLKESQINFVDFAFILNKNAVEALKPLGNLSFKGQFLGYPTDFVATGNFISSIGQINSDINLKIDVDKIENSQYRGSLALSQFNLGKYLKDTVNFQYVNMDGKIEGKGLTIQSADFTLNGTVASIGLKGYDYNNITTNARFSSNFFNGKIDINDPYLDFKAEGSIDLRNNLNRIQIKGFLNGAHFDKINISTKPLFIKTDLDVDMKGLELDSLVGTAHLTNSIVIYDKDSLSLQSVSLRAEKEKTERMLLLESTLLDAQVRGNFLFSNLFTDIQKLNQELQLNILNNQTDIAEYYGKKLKKSERYSAEFEFRLKDIKQIAALFDQDLDFSANTVITGKYTNGPTNILQAYSMIDSIRQGSNEFYKTELDVNISKADNNPEALAMVYIQSREQFLNKIKTNGLITEVIWNDKHIDAELSISQQGTTNRFDLNGTVDFKDSTLIKLHPSTIRVLENDWHVHPDNGIIVSGKTWTFNDFGFEQTNQSIDLNGKISNDAADNLELTIQNFNLSNINPIITRKLEGILEAKVILSNYYNTPSIQNNVEIKSLELDDFLIGNVTGNNTWQSDLKRFNLEFFIDRLNNRIVNCQGFYDPDNDINPLSISANFNNANLKIFEPFIDEMLSQFQGTLTGTYTIRGTLDAPVFGGEARIDDGSLLVNYLQTKYQFRGYLGLTENSVYFKDVELTDVFRNKGKLNGAITHSFFRNAAINLEAEFSNFQVLNTTSKDNTLFYGQGYATGVVNFTGPLNNLAITATAVTQKNTKIYIPISGNSSVEKKDYINFVSFTDSTYLASQQVDLAKRINLTGVTIDFNLDVTPDAYCEIIFDLKAGDIVRGRGNGKIKLQLDTKGDFNMFGPIEFTEGWYNFTLYDIINKEFQIQPGSSIVWYGDPYQGTMKIDATYNQLASLGPILTDPSLSEMPQLKRKYPVQVLLKLEGPMLSPVISFDIVADDLPKSIAVEGRPPVSLDLEFVAFKNKLDEQELKRQVFSLIILRRFSPPESFDTSGTLVSSVSELFSNQLSYWLSQVDENLEIDVNLGSMDAESFNTFQLRMSYTFMSGRLRVTRDGTVGNQNLPGSTTPNTGSELANAIGDWTVDYLLTPDGKFKVKMYSRTNTNSITNNINSQTAYTTGVSLMHTQSFNDFRDLLKSSRDKNKRTLPNVDESNEEALKEEENDN